MLRNEIVFLMVASAACGGRVDGVETASGSPSASGSGEASGRDPSRRTPPGTVSADAPPASRLMVDGVACELGIESLHWETPPAWSLLVLGKCGAGIGDIEIGVSSRNDVPYPQTCSSTTAVQAKTWGDRGYFESTEARCKIYGGPTAQSLASPVGFMAVVQEPTSGVGHVISLEAKSK